MFARRGQGALATGICYRTAALVCAMPDVEALGDPIKSYESFTREELIAREQPYTTYWRTCITPARLVGERGLRMDNHCLYRVNAVIDREGNVRGFRIVKRPDAPHLARRCPPEIDAHVAERVTSWRFVPASIDGVPIEVRLTDVSTRSPWNEAEYEKHLQEQSRRVSTLRLKKEIP